MTKYQVAAHIDERGRITGGKPGDQTGNEVSISTYDNYPWDCVLRYTGKSAKRVRNRLMKAAVRLAKGNKVGYNQDTRTTLYYQMQRLKWWLKRVGKISKCNTDCSAFIAVCVNIALVPIKLAKPLPDYIWTGNMVDEICPLGFKKLRSGINFNTGAGLEPGDILLNVANHTSLYLGTSSTGELYNSEPNKETIKPANLEAIAQEVIDGVFGNGDDRINNLIAAGYDPAHVQSEVNRILGYE